MHFASGSVFNSVMGPPPRKPVDLGGEMTIFFGLFTAESGAGAGDMMRSPPIAIQI